MAGQVTGNLGSENITLRNMATEDTLAEILEVLGTKTISDNGTGKLIKNAGEAGGKLKVAGEAALSLGKLFSSVGSGTVKIVRHLDSNINNISYTFSTLATSLQRDNPKIAKLFGFAAESAAQMQEQFNAYSKMMQVGGSTASEFGDLRKEAAGLGTDLNGLAALTDQYAFSLKVGSTSVSGGLKKLSAAYKDMSDQTITEFGRLGILPEKISEQLLLAAEAQGGVGDVMKRFGGNTKEFSKGMLKSTQELNVFATAIGSNSQLMQQEMAKANQKITNRIFTDSLTDNEKKATAYLQAFTGSADDAIGVMRMYKTGLASQNSALFESLKGFTGMGNQIENFVGLVSKGTEPFEAIQQSGLLAFAKGMSKADLDNAALQVQALANSGQDQQAALLGQQLTFIKGLRDTDPAQMAKYVKDMTEAFDPAKNKTVDSFTALQNQQVKLAQSTAHLNTQINRLGLSLAAGSMKSANLAIGGFAKGEEGIENYVNAMLASYGIKAQIPKDLLKGPVDKIEEWTQRIIDLHLSESTAEKTERNQQSLEPVPTSADSVKVKMLNGREATIRVSDLINDARVRATTEAFKGAHNQTGTMIAASMLQQRVKSLGMVTAGDDDDPIHNTKGYHPLGQALDFRVNEDPTKTREQNFEDTRKNIIRVLKDFGLSEKDFAVINELNAKGGAHMHVEFKNPEAVNAFRNKYLESMKPQPGTQNQSEAPKAGSQENAGKGTDGGKSSQANQGTVNTIPVVSVSKPDWFDEAMNNSKTELKTWMQQMSRDFDKLATTLAKKL